MFVFQWHVRIPTDGQHCLFWLLACDYALAKWHIQTYTENKESYEYSVPRLSGKLTSGDGATENSIARVWEARCPRVKAANHLFFLFYPKAKSWSISQTRGKIIPTSGKPKELVTEWVALGFPTLNLSQLGGQPPGEVLQIKPSWRSDYRKHTSLSQNTVTC